MEDFFQDVNQNQILPTNYESYFSILNSDGFVLRFLFGYKHPWIWGTIDYLEMSQLSTELFDEERLLKLRKVRQLQIIRL